MPPLVPFLPAKKPYPAQSPSPHRFFWRYSPSRRVRLRFDTIQIRTLLPVARIYYRQILFPVFIPEFAFHSEQNDFDFN